MRLVAAIVAGFIAGVAIGVVAGKHWKTEPLPAATTTAARPAPAALEAGAAPAAPAPARSGATTTPGAPSKDARKAVQKLFAAVPAPPHEEGTGEIAGHVRRKDGQPVEGAMVRATPQYTWPPRPRRDVKQREDVEERVLDFVAYLRSEEVFRREAITNSEGAYRITGLLDCKYEVKATFDGFDFRGGGYFPGVGTERTVDFVATRTIEFLAQVLLPEGSPAREAEIHWNQINGGSSSLQIWTPNDPYLLLREGSYEVYAISRDREHRSETLNLELQEGDEVRAITLALRRRAGIEGKVIFSPEEARAGVTVAALLLTGQETAPAEKLLEAKAIDLDVQLDVEGGFTLPDLRQGRYLVGARRGYRRIVATEVVNVLDGYVSVDLVLPSPGPADGVLVRVYGPSGQIVRDVTFLKTFRKGTKTWNSWDPATCLLDGSFRLPIEGPEEMAQSTGSRCFLIITSEEYGEREVEYRPGETQEVDVRYEEPATLDIEVANYRGSGQESRVLLFLEPKKEGTSPDPASSKDTMRPDAEGKLSLTKLQPGSYVLGVVLSDEWPSTPAVETPIELKSGKNSIRLDLPPRLAAPPERR